VNDRFNFVLMVLSLGASFLRFADILPVSVVTARHSVVTNVDEGDLGALCYTVNGSFLSCELEEASLWQARASGGK